MTQLISESIPDLRPRQTSASFASFDVPHQSPFVCDIVASHERISRAVDHVSNIEIVRWLDRAAELHADSLGYTRQWLLDHGIMWFVARHEIDYLAEAFPDDELQIVTWVRDMRKVKSWRDYLIVRPKDETVICRAATLWVLVELESRRPQRIEREMADRFNPLNPHP